MNSPLLSSPVRPSSEALMQEVPRPSGKVSPEDAAKQFEGMLMTQIFQVMRKTVQHSELFGDSGMARSTYEYLLDQAVVDHAMSSGKGWGLASRLEESWAAREASEKIKPQA